MTSTVFKNFTSPAIPADWLNDLNRLNYTVFGNPTNAQTARTNLGLGTAATVNTGTGAANVPTTAEADARYAPIAGNSTQTFAVANATAADEATAFGQLAPLYGLISGIGAVHYAGSGSPGTVSLGDAPLGLAQVTDYYSDGPVGTSTALYGVLITRNSTADAHPTTASEHDYFSQTLYDAGNHVVFVRFNTNGGGWTPWRNLIYGDSGIAYNVANATAADEAVALGQFLNSFVNNGYSKLPGGLIWQWMRITTSSNGYANFTLPIAFPNNLLGVSMTVIASTIAGWSGTWDSGSSSLSSLQLAAIGNSSNYGAMSFSVLAWGN